MIRDCSDLPNSKSTRHVRITWNDDSEASSQTANMAGKRHTPPRMLGHHWYLAEWSKVRGKRQADAQRELGWPKATTSDLWNGKQRYTQNLVDQAAKWLDIEPFELLMPPSEALALRQMRQAAYLIAAEPGADFTPPPAANGAPRRTGTKG